MFLVDTNVVSELRRLDRCNPAVAGWSRQVPADHLFLSAITVLEIRQGILRIRRRDRVQADILQTWLDRTVLPRFGGRILSFDVAVALRCAELHVPDPMPDRDSMIAATALVNDFVVVTRNTADFESCGVRLFNPWLYAPPA